MKRKIVNLTSALMAILMLSLSSVGCVEDVAGQIEESMSEEKQSEKNGSAESQELQNSTEKKEEADNDDEQGSSLGDLEITEKEDEDDDEEESEPDNNDGDNNDDDNNGGDNNGGDNTGGEGTGDNGDEPPVVVTHEIVYGSGGFGRIEGEAEQAVAHGESATTVKAIPNTDYIFVRWSDGYKNAERTDTNVTNDIMVYPVFYHKDTEFTATYIVTRAGAEVARSQKTVKIGESASYTAPAPTLAYEFAGWEDGVKSATRSDMLYENIQVVGEYLPVSLGVPSISIVTEDRQGIAVPPEGAGAPEIYYKPIKECTVSLYNFDEDGCFENLSARIRGRGKSSWTAHAKKGFKIKFDEQIRMLGSSYKSKNWNFISNHADKSFLRNMIAYDMSAAFDGLDYTPMHKFIDVYIDGEYYGFFMLCDDLDVGKGRIEYDKTVYADPSKTAFFVERGANHQGESSCHTCVTIKASGNDKYRTYCIKFPDEEGMGEYLDEYKAYVSDYLYQCLYTMGNDNTSQNKWEEICALIDVDSFIDHYIIQELFMNKDAFWCSIFFYKAPGPDGKLYAGPVWDFDQGAGSVNDIFGGGLNEVTPYTDFSYVNSEYYKTSGTPWIADVNSWYRRLLRRPEFVELLQARLVELGPTIMEVLETADPDNPNGYYAIYGDSMERNFKRWNIMGKFVWPSSNAINAITSVPGQMDYMREWLIERYFVLCDYYGVGDQVADLRVSSSASYNGAKLIDTTTFISSVVILEERRREAEPEDEENNG